MKINPGVVIAILVLLLGGQYALGQNEGNQGTQPLTSQNAANSWRFVGVDPTKQTDTVDPEIRQARTAFWAKTLAEFAEIPGRLHGEMSGRAYLLSEPEFHKIPGELWVTGTFISYKVFPLPSIHLAYTEIQFLVQSVISANPPSGLAPSKVITLGLPGGTILEGGMPTSHFISPEQYSLKPGHSYLLQMFFHPILDFYSAGSGRSWDITSGTVEPNDSGEVERGKLGTSQIDGTPSSQIVQRMKAILAAR